MMPRQIFWLLQIVLDVLVATVAVAQTLTPHQIYEQRKSALVFLRNVEIGKDMGYGVVVSKQGHVLTANHVIEGFQGAQIRGSIGVKGPVYLYFDEDVSHTLAPFDLRLLKFKTEGTEFTPTPIGKPDHFRPGGTLVQVLTGFRDDGQPKILEARVTGHLGSPDLWRMQGAGVDVGHSGSPAYDQFGNLVGFVPRGIEATGVFDLRTFDQVEPWLKRHNVNIDPRVKGDKFSVYIVARAQEERRGALHKNITNIVQEVFRIKHIDAFRDGYLPEFMQSILGAPEGPAGDKLLEIIFQEDSAKAWLAQRDARLFYLYIIELSHPVQRRTPVRHFVLKLEHTSTEVRVHRYPLERAELIYPPSNTNERESDSETDDKIGADHAMVLLKRAAETASSTIFRDNGVVFTNCLDFITGVPPEVIKEVDSWRATAPQELKHQLTKRWKNHPEYHRYELVYGLPSMCRGPRVFGTKQASLQHKQYKELAQLIIDARLNGSVPGSPLAVHWLLIRQHPYKEHEWPDAVPVEPSVAKFAEGFAKFIDENWPNALEFIRR